MPQELFDEADFKQEGSLDVRSLAAAVSGEVMKGKGGCGAHDSPPGELAIQLSASRFFGSLPTYIRAFQMGADCQPYALLPIPLPASFTHTACSCSGRYPKRKLTKEWRQLVALLLGIPELVLTEDFVNAKVAVNVSNNVGACMHAERGLCQPDGGREFEWVRGHVGYVGPTGYFVRQEKVAGNVRMYR